MTRVSVLCAIACALAAPALAHRQEVQPVEVHIIPHSHCDPGYKKTVEGYYLTEVRQVLDSVVETLSRDPSLRFVWSESSYLWRWWGENPKGAAAFKRLVENRQIELVNGGWVMHDEVRGTCRPRIVRPNAMLRLAKKGLHSTRYDVLYTHPIRVLAPVQTLFFKKPVSLYFTTPWLDSSRIRTPDLCASSPRRPSRATTRRSTSCGRGTPSWPRSFPRTCCRASAGRSTRLGPPAGPPRSWPSRGK
jgi:hypothetical protein